MHLHYNLRNPKKILIRDLRQLLGLGVIAVREEKEMPYLHARLEWLTEITETEFFERIKRIPKAKTRLF